MQTDSTQKDILTQSLKIQRQPHRHRKPDRPYRQTLQIVRTYRKTLETDGSFRTTGLKDRQQTSREKGRRRYVWWQQDTIRRNCPTLFLFNVHFLFVLTGHALLPQPANRNLYPALSFPPSTKPHLNFVKVVCFFY